MTAIDLDTFNYFQEHHNFCDFIHIKLPKYEVEYFIQSGRLGLKCLAEELLHPDGEEVFDGSPYWIRYPNGLERGWTRSFPVED